MSDKVTEVLAEKSSISSVSATLTHEESTPSKNVSQPNADNCEKVFLTPDNDDVSTPTTTASSAQDKQDTEETTINSDKELPGQWSDEETFPDAIEAETDDSKDNPVSKKSETFFSDIESSDNSFGYEQEVKAKDTGEVQSGDQGVKTALEEDNAGKRKTIIEPEFELVESDEEFFEDPPLLEPKKVLSQENVSEEEQPWESDGVNEPAEDEFKSLTPVADNKLDQDSEVAESTDKNENIDTPEAEAELLEDGEDNEAPVVVVSKDLENIIDAENAKPKDVVDTEIENSGSENTLLGEECSKDKTESIEDETVPSESPIPAEKEASSSKISESLDKLEDLPTTDIPVEDEDSEMLQKVADDPGTIPTPKSVEDTDQPEPMETDDEVTEKPNPNDVEPSIETDKKEANATHLEQKDGPASVDKQPEIEESLESEEILLKADEVPEIQATDDFKMEEETTSASECQEELQKTVDENDCLKATKESEDNLLDSDKAPEENKTVPMVVEDISTEIVEKLESDEEMLSEHKQSCANSEETGKPELLERNVGPKTDGDENARDSAQNDAPVKLLVIETKELEAGDDDSTMSSKSVGKYRANLEDKKQPISIGEELAQNSDEGKNSQETLLNKEDKLPDLPTIETKETKDDDDLIMSPKSNDADNQTLDEKKQDEPLEKDILGDEVKESESEEKENLSDEPEELPEITQKPGDSPEKQPLVDKDTLDADESPFQNKKETPKSSHEQLTETTEIKELPDKSKPQSTEPSEIQESSKDAVELDENPEGDSTKKKESSQKVLETSPKSDRKVTDGNETPSEKDKNILEASKKQDEPVTHSTEKKEPLKEIIETPEESEQATKVITKNEESSKKPEESSGKSNLTEKKDSPEKLLEASDKQAKDSTEKEDSSKEDEGSSKETDVSLKDSKKSEEVISSEAIISSDKENLASKSAEIPKLISDVLVEKIVEVTTTKIDNKTSLAAMEPPSEVVAPQQDANNSTRTMDPNIIEIDDDEDEDDDLEAKKKLESNAEKEEKSSSNEKDKETDPVTNANIVPDIPMELDEELMAENSEKPALKPEGEKASNQEVKTNQEFAKLDDIVPLKPNEITTTVNSLEEEEEETLLVIDTSHKEDNDNESNYMDNETATSAPSTDSSSEGSLELFYDKECINYECKRETKHFYRATLFTLSFFKITKKRTKIQFVCENCYDRALASYEDLCKTLKQKQPLLYGTNFKCQEFVEIIDSSDEEESDSGGGDKIKDENALPKESIQMLEEELEGAIRKVMYNVDIQNQLTWTKQILQQRLNNLQEDTDFVSEQLRALQKKADNMHNSLYQCPKIKLRQLTPLDLNSGRMYNPESENSISIPPPGEVIRLPIRLNEEYYAVKAKAIASWVPCKVIEESDSYPMGFNQTKTYKIKFTKQARYPMFKTVYAKHMAYYDPPNVRLPIGSRVIAYFDVTSLSRGKEKMLIPSAFYPGIIAEPLKQSNKFRYLVFYDDGYFQYVNHKDVRLVCQASENVWEDVHHQSREFIHNYLTQYAVNRPMVQTQKGQSMLVDYNGKWIYARVIDVDCSLVQMLFEGQSRSEWIYRGSTRLGPVYKESNNLSQKNTLNATRRRTEPFIRYINGDDSTSSQPAHEPEESQPKTSGGEIRAVAKKSVSRVDTSNNNSTPSGTSQQPIPTVRHLNNSTIFVDDDNKPKGKVVYYTARKNLPPRNFVPHLCNPSCPFNVTHNLSFYSPLAKPLLSGWERQVFRQKSKKFIVYRGPCGKRMRSIEELHRYLRITDNELNVDNFDFSPDTNCLAEYVLEKCLVNKKDISCGKEKMPIPCVNYYDETMPPACEYSAERIPTAGVPLNLNEEFMCGCDCEDDCSDKSKCACWELTYAGAKYGMPTVPIEMVGYQFKRLYEHVPTGIYECNSRCKCRANCVNRVVQQPLQSKLQVFKTSNRGWGLRCINDVPRGSFICVYAGQLLTEQVANEGGLDAGDEYFAELDYIEVAEQIKEGYESDVQEPDEEEDIYNPEKEDDDFDFRAPSESNKDKEFTTRLRARRGTKNSTDSEFDSQERQVISFEPNKTMDTSNEPNEKPTIRKLFGRDESCYVMDAKVRGNLGRYFNHSCSPNLFVQNVFVDTHDLRFPWVAFFASTHIRAGTELTWNYNYEVGVVPGKVLYCQCGAPNCRQRLL